MGRISYLVIFILLFILKNQHRAIDQVIKAVRKICSALDGVETPAVTEAVKKLKRAVNLPRNKSADVSMCVDLSDHCHLHRMLTSLDKIFILNF